MLPMFLNGGTKRKVRKDTYVRTYCTYSTFCTYTKYVCTVSASERR